MKEAAGEANLSVITIILMGIISLTFLTIIPRIMSSIKDKACCVSNNGKVEFKNSKYVCTYEYAKSKVSNKFNPVYTSESLNNYNKHCK